MCLRAGTLLSFRRPFLWRKPRSIIGYQLTLLEVHLQGVAQIRQSFAKRKRGLTQKAYQLHKIADAKVRSTASQSCLTVPNM